MSHTTQDKTRLLARVRRIRGQVDAIERSLDAEKECAGILHQIAAVRGAVQGLMGEVMESHIRGHIAGSDLSSQAERELGATELIDVIRTYLK
ncbi:metal/formaldehyde-sensitive transcriptional repressor [Castellaniella sp.]|uniref:metal/formaldehyde-sensitive transcriptional repressor n=1 Tax=Castellaniella sp. TaxID=1955812 RepID=UPI003C72D8A2